SFRKKPYCHNAPKALPRRLPPARPRLLSPAAAGAAFGAERWIRTSGEPIQFLRSASHIGPIRHGGNRPNRPPTSRAAASPAPKRALLLRRQDRAHTRAMAAGECAMRIRLTELTVLIALVAAPFASAHTAY